MKSSAAKSLMELTFLEMDIDFDIILLLAILYRFHLHLALITAINSLEDSRLADHVRRFGKYLFDRFFQAGSFDSKHSN